MKKRFFWIIFTVALIFGILLGAFIYNSAISGNSIFDSLKIKQSLVPSAKTLETVNFNVLTQTIFDPSEYKLITYSIVSPLDGNITHRGEFESSLNFSLTNIVPNSDAVFIFETAHIYPDSSKAVALKVYIKKINSMGAIVIDESNIIESDLSNFRTTLDSINNSMYLIQATGKVLNSMYPSTPPGWDVDNTLYFKTIDIYSNYKFIKKLNLGLKQEDSSPNYRFKFGISSRDNIIYRNSTSFSVFDYTFNYPYIMNFEINPLLSKKIKFIDSINLQPLIFSPVSEIGIPGEGFYSSTYMNDKMVYFNKYNGPNLLIMKGLSGYESISVFFDYCNSKSKIMTLFEQPFLVYFSTGNEDDFKFFRTDLKDKDCLWGLDSNHPLVEPCYVRIKQPDGQIIETICDSAYECTDCMIGNYTVYAKISNIFKNQNPFTNAIINYNGTDFNVIKQNMNPGWLSVPSIS